MDLNSKIGLIAILWIFLLIINFAIVSKISVRRSGISHIYIANFALVHFFGSAFFALPGYWNKNLDLTAVGFEYSTYALVSFLIGNIFFLGLYKNKGNFKKISYAQFLKSKNTARYFLLIGLFLYIASNYIRGASISVFISISTPLIISSLCIFSFIAYVEKNQKKLLFYIAAGFFIPIFTIIVDGFIGVAIAMLIALLIFINNFYKFNLRKILIFILLCYLGLSFYIIYTINKSTIRASVWGGESYSSRVVTFTGIFNDFEFFNPTKHTHLDLINTRLNQNSVVGASVNYLNNGNIEFAKGETYKQALIGLVPRVLWKNKPITAGDTSRVEKYSGLKFTKNVSVGMPQVMEMYVNFGMISLILGFLIVGIFYGYLDVNSGIHFYNLNSSKFLIYFLPGLALMRVETPFVESLAAAAASLAISLALFTFPKRYIKHLFFFAFLIITLFIVRKYYLPLIR